MGITESFPRVDLLAIPKFLAEAKPPEQKTILCWVVDTRQFIIALPKDKHATWTRSIDKILGNRYARMMTKELETTLGRRSHAAYVILHARHLMGRLYKACERSKRSGTMRLTRPHLDNFTLRKSFFLKGGARNLDQPAGLSMAVENRTSGRVPPRNWRLLSQERHPVAVSAAWELVRRSYAQHFGIPRRLRGNGRRLLRRTRVDVRGCFA